MVITQRFVSGYGLNLHISVIQEESSVWPDHITLFIDIDSWFRVELPQSYSQEEIEAAAEDLIEDYLSTQVVGMIEDDL